MFLKLDEKRYEKKAMVDNLGQFVTYGKIAEKLYEMKKILCVRSVAFCLCRNTVGSMMGYLSFIECGVVPLTLSDKINEELLNNLINIYKPYYLWVPCEEKNNYEFDVIYEMFDYALLRTRNELYPINSKLEMLMTTSGSTGSPKLVRYKKGNLEINAKNVAIAFGWTNEERPICDLGMQYTMGLNVINTHLYVGATVFLTEYNIMSSDFWDYLKTNKCTNFTGVPFSYELFNRLRFFNMDLPFLSTLSQGGGKLTDERFKQLADYAKKNNKRFIPSFGTTETSARMACLPFELSCEKIGSIGRAIPEGELFLIDSEGCVIENSEAEGELCYKGPNVTMGYAECLEDLNKDDEFNGIYKTGDIAKRDEDGCYYITGRKKRFVKVLSYRVSLDQIERIVQNKFDIDCACTGNDEIINIYKKNDVEKEEVRNFLSEKLGLYKNFFNVVTVAEILRNESGKILYNKMDELYLRMKG